MSRTSTQATATDSNQPYEALSAPAHTLDAKAILSAYESTPRLGLSEAAHSAALSKYGPNRLKETPPPSFWKILLRNSLNAMTMVLIAAMAVSKCDSIDAAIVWAKSLLFRKVLEHKTTFLAVLLPRSSF